MAPPSPSTSSNLNVSPGEIYGFIRPNGTGKTTTIRMMGGLLAPTAGWIIIGGIDMTRNPVVAKKLIDFVPDRPFLYEKLTDMEFLRFSAELYDVNAEAFQEKAEELLRRFALWNWADEIIETYSHGMKQTLIIVAIAARFVFPEVSMEGAAFWIIRAVPVSLKTFL